jgi:murein DD-endopeptidase MepM/ murein hydrolase activator NlpD
MQKRRSDKISILIVPEDEAEPYSFRLKRSVVKLLYVVGVVLLAHTIIGAIFYWKYAELHRVNQHLLSYNRQLQEDNKRVLAVSEEFFALEREYQKVRNLLGVEGDVGIATATAQAQAPTLFENIVPAARTEFEPRQLSLGAPGRFLSPGKRQLAGPESIPNLLPVEGFMTQDFWVDEWIGLRSHTGIDIVSKKGTVIRAAGAGSVLFSNWTYDYGYLIIIDHGGGLLSYYGHNQRLLKSERSYVSRGEPVALLGNSGKSSGPHLHFEIRKEGRPVDPKEYLLAFSDIITTSH